MTLLDEAISPLSNARRSGQVVPPLAFAAFKKKEAASWQK